MTFNFNPRLNNREDIPEITPSIIPEMEAFVQRAYENNPGATEKKTELLDILNQEHFDDNRFRVLIDQWNTEMQNTKGFNGQHGEIDNIRGKNGTLKVYHFRGSDSIKFGYTLG